MKTMDIQHLRECLEYNPTTGSLIWKKRPSSHFKTQRDCNAWNTRFSGKKAGVKKSTGRIELTVDNKKFRAHRVAWAIHHGTWPENEIDHKDVNQSHNLIGNLRPATRQQNQRNLKLNRKNTSGFKGVTWFAARNKFKAQIKVRNKCLHLGLFSDPSEAHKAYCAAADQYHGDFANYGH